MYCVYLTIYGGNKMPPFYIGSSSVEKVKNGYKGTVSSKKYLDIWTTELKDNPHLFESKIICAHETRQEATDKEYKFHKQLNVVKNPLYINQAMANKNGFFGMDNSGELNFMYRKFGKDNPNYGKSRSDVTKGRISISNIGKKRSEKTRKKQSDNMKGKLIGEKNPMYGKKRNMSSETRHKMSVSQLGTKQSEETKKKKSIVMTNKVRSAEHSKKISVSNTGKPSANKGKRHKWITNNIEHRIIPLDASIPDGWVRGMLPKKRKSGNPK